MKELIEQRRQARNEGKRVYIKNFKLYTVDQAAERKNGPSDKPSQEKQSWNQNTCRNDETAAGSESPNITVICQEIATQHTAAHVVSGTSTTSRSSVRKEQYQEFVNNGARKKEGMERRWREWREEVNKVRTML